MPRKHRPVRDRFCVRGGRVNSLGASSTTPAPEGGASNSSVILSETEVYAKVADLFNHHEDLLAEFSQFLPDASQQPTVNICSRQGQPHSLTSSSFTWITQERSNSISDILSSSTSDSSLAIGNTHASNITPRVIIGHPISSFVTAPSSSFTILSSNATMTRDERSLSPSAKRTAATVASQKRIGSAVKSPAIAKKKRLSAMNGPSTITDMHISDGTGQNQRLPSMDEIAFFHQVRKIISPWNDLTFPRISRFKRRCVVRRCSTISSAVFFCIQNRSFRAWNCSDWFTRIWGNDRPNKIDFISTSGFLVTHLNYWKHFKNWSIYVNREKWSFQSTSTTKATAIVWSASVSSSLRFWATSMTHWF